MGADCRVRGITRLKRPSTTASGLNGVRPNHLLIRRVRRLLAPSWCLSSINDKLSSVTLTWCAHLAAHYVAKLDLFE